MAGAKPVIVCVPEARAEFGFGHLSRQCILVNALCQHGRDARLVLPDEAIRDTLRQPWLAQRIAADLVLRCADARSLLDDPEIDAQLVIDSYDYAHTAATVGRDPTRDALTVFDDLAYERNFPPNVIGVIPNICSRQQQALMAVSRPAGAPGYVYGPHYLLLDPAFVLAPAARVALLAERQRRLTASTEDQRPLILLIGFGGSAALPDEQGRAGLVTLLQHIRGHAAVEVRCIGTAAAALCRAIDQPAHSLGWLDVVDLRQAYLDADVYLGAIGYSMWERAALLLPSFVVPIAANQLPYAATGEELGIHRVIPMASEDGWLADSFTMQTSAFGLQANGCGYLSLFQ
jgi:spore coat polysaccharide biosynthesis predicted glycosyltransferase SpsG